VQLLTQWSEKLVKAGHVPRVRVNATGKPELNLEKVNEQQLEQWRGDNKQDKP
jgi:hypothetical protein